MTASSNIKRKFSIKKESITENAIPSSIKKIPIRAGGWDRALIGQEQIDLVEHCGSSAAGEFINSVSVADISSGWWEGEAVMGKGQGRTFTALTRIRRRTPFSWIEIHPDNDTPFINWHLLRYAQEEKIKFSRSRPYKKNDNCFVEQKNSTHIRSTFGHLRYDTEKELGIINDLYRNELRLHKNFFQPGLKLKEKVRDKGKIHRKYDIPKTPYQRVIESGQISEETKKKLENLYLSLNPAELKRNIDKKVRKLYKTYEEKKRENEVYPFKKQKPRTVTNYMTQQPLVGLPT